MDMLAQRCRSREDRYTPLRDSDADAAVDPALQLVPTPFPLGMRDALRSPRRDRDAAASSDVAVPSSVVGEREAVPPEYPQDTPVYTPAVPPSYDQATLAAIRASKDMERESGEVSTNNQSQIDSKVPIEDSRIRATTGASLHRQPLSDEKKQIELDRLANALDRAYGAAPQLENQRAEPSGSRERTRVAAGETAGEGGKGKERASSEAKEEELVEIWNRIERAHGNRLRDQAYDVDVARQAIKERQRVSWATS